MEFLSSAWAVCASEGSPCSVVEELTDAADGDRGRELVNKLRKAEVAVFGRWEDLFANVAAAAPWLMYVEAALGERGSEGGLRDVRAGFVCFGGGSNTDFGRCPSRQALHIGASHHPGN